MKRTSDLQPYSLTLKIRVNGTFLLTVPTTGEWPHRLAEAAPRRVFPAGRLGSCKHVERYGAALEQVRAGQSYNCEES